MIKCKFYRGSHNTVVNELQQRFWIIELRQGLRNLFSKCVVCKILRALPTNSKMAKLPLTRLAYRLRPFSHTGLDYFGPMMVKIGNRKNSRQKKIWGVLLFTCMTTRAIHLEIAHSLNADSLIMAIKRFISQRGIPVPFYSDNYSNLKKASKELMMLYHLLSIA